MELMNIKIGGKDYVLSPMKVGDYSAMMRFLKKRKLDEISDVFKDLPDKKIELLQSAMAAEIGVAEQERSTRDPDVVLFLLHRLLVVNQPEMTFEKVSSTVSLEELEAITNAVRLAMTGGKKDDPPPPPANA